jgi:hypothetical protein
MAEKVARTGVSKESGYLYYLGKDGNVWRSGMSRGGEKEESALPRRVNRLLWIRVHNEEEFVLVFTRQLPKNRTQRCVK